MMLMFRLVFVLSFVKLSVGNGFQLTRKFHSLITKSPNAFYLMTVTKTNFTISP